MNNTVANDIPFADLLEHAEFIEHALKSDPRCKAALELYYGIDDRGPMTYKQVGETLGRKDGAGPVSAERARQLIHKGQRMVRSAFRKVTFETKPAPETPLVPTFRPPKTIKPNPQAVAFNRHTRPKPKLINSTHPFYRSITINYVY